MAQKKEVALIADKARIMPILFQFSDEFKLAIKNGTVVRLLFEGESLNNSLKKSEKAYWYRIFDSHKVSSWTFESFFDVG